MQIGLDYRRPTCNCHEIFLRIALDAQYWHNAGSANTQTAAGFAENNQEADLGFFGFTIGTGIDY